MESVTSQSEYERITSVTCCSVKIRYVVTNVHDTTICAERADRDRCILTFLGRVTEEKAL